MKRRRLALAIAVLFTAVAAVGFCLGVGMIVLSFYYRPTIERAGSGGIGAVSVGVAETILPTLPFVAAAVFVNLSVAAEARRNGRAAVRIRRAHIAFTVLTLILAIPATLLTIAFMQPDPWIFENLMLIAAACGVLLSAGHSAFGVFAITLLRRG